MFRNTAPSQIERVLALATHVALRFPDLNEDDTADIAQEVTIAYLAGETRPAENWQAWVTTVTKNRAIDYRRRRRPVAAGREVRDDDEPMFVRHQFNRRPSEKVRARLTVAMVLDGLSSRDQEMLELDAQGYSNEEIARAVGLANANSAAVTLSRIRRRIRERYPGLVGDVDDPRLY